MGRIIIILATFVAGFAGLSAQISQEEVSIVQNLYGMEKRTIYMQVMDLTPTDSLSFWPLYDKFEMERKELGMRRVRLMQQLTSKYPNISNEEIDEIVEESHEIAEEMLSLEKDFYDEIKEVTSVAVAAKFYQIERFLNTAISMKLAENLPFIGEFNIKSDKK